MNDVSLPSLQEDKKYPDILDILPSHAPDMPVQLLFIFLGLARLILRQFHS